MTNLLNYNPETGLYSINPIPDYGYNTTVEVPLLTTMDINSCVILIEGTAIQINSNYINNTINGIDRPYVNGIVLNSANYGEIGIIATRRGMKYYTPTSLGISGNFIYLDKHGKLTTIPPSISNGDTWYTVVGYRVNEHEFIFDPQDPILAPQESVEFIEIFNNLNLINRTLIIEFSNNITINPTAKDVGSILLTGNTTINISPGIDKQKFLLELTQDNIGGRIVTWGNAISFGTDITDIVLTQDSNITDYIGFIFNANTNKWRLIGYSRGY